MLKALLIYILAPVAALCILISILKSFSKIKKISISLKCFHIKITIRIE